MGEVVGPYGVRGWLKVRSLRRVPGRAARLRDVVAEARARRGLDASSRGSDGRMHSGALVVALDGVDTREAALAMKGFEVGVPRAALPAAAEGEIYWDDLTGLAVVNRAGVAAGRSARRSRSMARIRCCGSRAAGGARTGAADPVRRRRSSTGSMWTAAGSRWIGARTTEGRWFRGRRMRIDVVTLFPEMVDARGAVRRDRAGAAARAVAARRVEPARFRDGQAPDRRRPPVRRRAGNGDAGGAAGERRSRRRRAAQRGGRLRGDADAPPVAGRHAADAPAGGGAGGGGRRDGLRAARRAVRGDRRAAARARGRRGDRDRRFRRVGRRVAGADADRRDRCGSARAC